MRQICESSLGDLLLEINNPASKSLDKSEKGLPQALPKKEIFS